MRNFIVSFFLALSSLLAAPAVGKDIEDWAIPYQESIPSKTINLPTGIAHLQAKFSVEGMVLGMMTYSDGWEGSVAPIDLAMGWGPLKERESLDAVKFTQADRFYYWKVDGKGEEPWTAKTVSFYSSNIHLVFSNPGLRMRALTLRPGDKIRLTGFLIDVHRPDGYVWQTSMRRDDTGAGACEILYVTDISISTE